MEIYLSSSFKRSYKRRIQKYPKKVIQVKETLSIFRTDQNYPSLNLHKLSGNNRWSIKVRMDLIITLVYVDEGVLLMDIGSHDEVY